MIFWLLVLACWGFATVLLYLGWTAPAEKAAEAALAQKVGFGFVAAGVALLLIRRAVVWLIER